jgi:hypothetical protein
VEKLQKKFCTPHYYGFMISAGDSGQLQLWSAKLARTILQIDQVSHAVDSATQKLLLQQFAERSDEELAEWKECQDLFHCTAFYTALGKRPGDYYACSRLLLLLVFKLIKSSFFFKLKLQFQKMRIGN